MGRQAGKENLARDVSDATRQITTGETPPQPFVPVLPGMPWAPKGGKGKGLYAGKAGL